MNKVMHSYKLRIEIDQRKLSNRSLQLRFNINYFLILLLYSSQNKHVKAYTDLKTINKVMRSYKLRIEIDQRKLSNRSLQLRFNIIYLLIPLLYSLLNKHVKAYTDLKTINKVMPSYKLHIVVG